MAGKKQHFIPKSVLRGFLIDSPGNNLQTWAFVKERSPFQVSIDNFAAQRYFYSNNDNSSGPTLDDKITDYEGGFSALLNSIRGLPSGSSADPGVVAELISHLVIRGAFARDIFKNGASQMLGLIESNVQKEGVIRQLLLTDEPDSDSPLRKALREEVEKHEKSGVFLPPNFENEALAFIDGNFEFLLKSLNPSLSDFFSSLSSVIPDAARNGHVRALEQGLAPEIRVKSLESMNWYVRDSFSPLVLPDCIAVAGCGDSGEVMPYLLSESDKFDRIAMPLSSSRILVGCISSETDNLFSDFNVVAARCSDSFFVSAVNDNNVIGLIPFIGEVSNNLISSTIAEVVDERFSKKIDDSY